MSPLGPCVYCGATLESTIAHVCPTHPGGHPPKTFWASAAPMPDEMIADRKAMGGGVDIGERIAAEVDRVIARSLVDPSRRGPSHYTWHPSGLQPKDFVGEFPYNIGTAMAYEWRAGRKEGVDVLDDLRKAIRHLEFEVERIEAQRARTK